MLDSASQSPSELLHACVDVAIAIVAGGLVLLVFYPVTLCAAAVKGLLAILRLRARETRKRAEGQFASQDAVTHSRNDNQRRQHVAHL